MELTRTRFFIDQNDPVCGRLVKDCRHRGIYDAKDVHLSIDGRVVQNFQDGDMFNVTVKEELTVTEWIAPERV